MGKGKNNQPDIRTTETQKSYNTFAEQYAKRYPMTPQIKEILDLLAENLKPGDKVLSLGSGHGRDEYYLAHDKGLKVHGIDNAENMISYANQHNKSTPESPIYEQMDMREIKKLEDNSYNAILAMTSLLHLQKKDIFPVLTDSYDLLKKDGKLFISLSIKDKEKEELITSNSRIGPKGERMIRGMSDYTKETIEEVIKKAGFEIEEIIETKNEEQKVLWSNIYARKLEESSTHEEFLQDKTIVADTQDKNINILLSKEFNQEGISFNDISSEQEREYEFANNKKLYISHPSYLGVKDGKHYLTTTEGKCYIIELETGKYINWNQQSVIEKNNKDNNTIPQNILYINNTSLDFEQITGDEEITIESQNKKEPIIIKNPLYKHISKSGGYRIFTKDGYCYYIQSTQGRRIRRKVKNGEPHFVK